MRTKLHNLLGKGLKRARKDKSKREGKLYGQQDFAYDMDVSKDTVRDWEQDYHFPKIPELLDMCDNVFQCDLDYLFMRSDVKKHDVEFIMEYTGLSEEAVEKLVELKDQPSQTIKALNTLLTSANFENTLTFLEEYMEKSAEYVADEKIMDNRSKDSLGKDIQYSKYEASTNFSFVLDEIKKLVKKDYHQFIN